jgi:hypothetical protein
MNFEPNEEQAAIFDAVMRVLAPFRTVTAAAVVQRTVYASDLEHTLSAGGYFDIGAADADSRVTAAMIVAEIAKLPVCIEAAASMLVKPVVSPQAQGPLAIIWGEVTRPTRFLPQARSALIAVDNAVRFLPIEPGDVEEVSSLFAYPVGRLKAAAAARASDLGAEAVKQLRHSSLVGVALEIYGALHAASTLTIDHVTQRRQFRRPLGAFQAIQHRLSMNATSIEAIRWLAMKAAFSGLAVDASLAGGYAQQAVATIAYDVHQFSGAMGLTLEYPLHLYTYRARMLQSEFGGAQAQIAAAAAEAWPDANDVLAR